MRLRKKGRNDKKRKRAEECKTLQQVLSGAQANNACNAALKAFNAFVHGANTAEDLKRKGLYINVDMIKEALPGGSHRNKNDIEREIPKVTLGGDADMVGWLFHMVAKSMKHDGNPRYAGTNDLTVLTTMHEYEEYIDRLKQSREAPCQKPITMEDTISNIRENQEYTNSVLCM